MAADHYAWSCSDATSSRVIHDRDSIIRIVSSAQIADPDTLPTRTAWNALPIGAGFVGDIDIATTRKAIRTHTYGGYVCRAPCTPSGTPGWSQVLLMNTMPSGDPGVGLQKGARVMKLELHRTIHLASTCISTGTCIAVTMEAHHGKRPGFPG